MNVRELIDELQEVSSNLAQGEDTPISIRVGFPKEDERCEIIEVIAVTCEGETETTVEIWT